MDDTQMPGNDDMGQDNGGNEPAAPAPSGDDTPEGDDTTGDSNA